MGLQEVGVKIRVRVTRCYATDYTDYTDYTVGYKRILDGLYGFHGIRGLHGLHGLHGRLQEATPYFHGWSEG